MRGQSPGAILSLTQESVPPSQLQDQSIKPTLSSARDDGVIIMNAYRDEDGEMVATDVLDAAHVTARFQNVAERHGKVDLEFQIVVPEEMQDSKWQVRFRPEMEILSEKVPLDEVLVTGRNYRKAQLRGYQQYQKFLNSIITDTTRFINLYQLEVFLKRNIPQVYAFKTDTSYVSDEQFASVYGVTERQAVDHYTNFIRVRRNERKAAMTDKMYRKYVKSPIISEGLRLDTVLQAVNGDFIYRYVQTITTRPKLKKVDITMDGDIFEQDRHIYTIPRSEPLTFYISSLSSFVDESERYLTQVIERNVAVGGSYNIDFEQGRSDIVPSLSDNASEISRIKSRLMELMSDDRLELDSITVSASSSPEGSLTLNRTLTQRRSESVSDYFSAFIRRSRDSLVRADGLFYRLDGSAAGGAAGADRIKFSPRGMPENWGLLDELVKRDSLIDNNGYDKYCEFAGIEDLDLRETMLRGQPYYRHLLEDLYPKLRTVRFDFYLHRRGMLKDTLHTNALDTAYMRGIQALIDHDYETAVTILRPYKDFNAAIALCSMDYNASARSILEGLPPSAPVCYLLAVLYAREGNDTQAVRSYIAACRQDRSLIHRGNLDPEISSIIKRYGLEAELTQTDNEEDYYSHNPAPVARSVPGSGY